MKTISKSAFSLFLLLVLVPLSSPARSLWLSPTNDERGLTADQRAGRVGDLVTIAVHESTRMTQSQNTVATRNSSVDATVNRFLFSPSVSRFGTHQGELPATSVEGGKTHQGGGSITNSQVFTTQFTVRVIDRLPNGNLIIEGVRHILVSGERHFIVLTGIIRAADISAQNVVRSDRIADVQLKFISEGSLTDAQKRSWFQKLYDFVNPF